MIQESPIANGETYVICDSAEEKSIHTLVRNNITAFGVKKPPGSVLTGIRKVANTTYSYMKIQRTYKQS
jgi:hypothetical protein